MKYQVVPVLFFTDSSGNIKHIHVDSWSTYGLNNVSSEVKISYSYNFMPLFSITPGGELLYFNFDFINFKKRKINLLIQKKLTLILVSPQILLLTRIYQKEIMIDFNIFYRILHFLKITFLIIQNYMLSYLEHKI